MGSGFLWKTWVRERKTHKKITTTKNTIKCHTLDFIKNCNIFIRCDIIKSLARNVSDERLSGHTISSRQSPLQLPRRSLHGDTHYNFTVTEPPETFDNSPDAFCFWWQTRVRDNTPITFYCKKSTTNKQQTTNTTQCIFEVWGKTLKIFYIEVPFILRPMLQISVAPKTHGIKTSIQKKETECSDRQQNPQNREWLGEQQSKKPVWRLRTAAAGGGGFVGDKKMELFGPPENGGGRGSRTDPRLGNI